MNFTKESRFHKKLEELAPKHFSKPNLVGIAYDLAKPPEKRVDVVVSKIFKKYQTKLAESKRAVEEFKKKHGRMDDSADFKKFKELYPNIKTYTYTERDLRSDLIKIRSVAIRQTKLNVEVRAGRNETFWSYGDVVVYRGKADRIVRGTLGNEAFLLSPAENGGKFFELPLDDSDTIILAPRKIIEEHVASGAKGFSNLFAYEDMSAEMLDKFKVPKQLRPQAK